MKITHVSATPLNVPVTLGAAGIAKTILHGKGKA